MLREAKVNSLPSQRTAEARVAMGKMERPDSSTHFCLNFVSLGLSFFNLFNNVVILEELTFKLNIAPCSLMSKEDSLLWMQSYIDLWVSDASAELPQSLISGSPSAGLHGVSC